MSLTYKTPKPKTLADIQQAEVKPPTFPKLGVEAERLGHSMKEVTKEVGLTASVLRVWEERYGWPKPERYANGYRYFSAAEVALLKQVKARLDKGEVIGEILRNGAPS